MTSVLWDWVVRPLGSLSFRAGWASVQWWLMVGLIVWLASR